MSDSQSTTAQFDEENLTVYQHMDADKHWIGETLPVPTQSEIAATIGVEAGPGDSPFVARADHTHKLDPAFLPQLFSFNPSSNTDATTSSTMATWITCSNVEVPTWAVSAIINININGMYTVTAAASYGFSAVINSTPAYGSDQGRFETTAINIRGSTSFFGSCSGFSSGTHSILIGARRFAGTGTMRADSNTLFTGAIWFRSA
jgi:hypothetical protein